jgi:hypothetical protein
MTVTPEDYRRFAVEQLESATAALRDDAGDAAVVGCELALMATLMWLHGADAGPLVLTPSDVTEMVAEPDCICPPDLVARGGFKGGCPQHSQRR